MRDWGKTRARADELLSDRFSIDLVERFEYNCQDAEAVLVTSAWTNASKLKKIAQMPKTKCFSIAILFLAPATGLQPALLLLCTIAIGW